MTSHVLQEAVKAHEGFITAQPEQYRFDLPLLRLLAEGKPVEPRHLASVAHCSLEEIQAVVPSSDVEVDQAGNLVGWGLSLVPTPHQFHLGETILYTWCALDALVFPTLLGRTAEARLPLFGNRQDRQPDRLAHARFRASQRLARSFRSGRREQTPTTVMSEEASACRDTSLRRTKQPSPGLNCIHSRFSSPSRKQPHLDALFPRVVQRVKLKQRKGRRVVLTPHQNTRRELCR